MKPIDCAGVWSSRYRKSPPGAIRGRQVGSHHTPGPYTFIVKAGGLVPRRARHQRRRTVGVRVPDHPVPHALLDALGAPIMSSSLLLPGDEEALLDGWEIRERLAGQLDLILDGGRCGSQPTTVVDLTEDPPLLLRRGLGDPAALGLR